MRVEEKAEEQRAFDGLSKRPVGTNPKSAYFPALDGLRGVAVLLVFFGHYASLSIGWMGVNIFFVLSGFLITGVLYDARYAKHRFRDFYARRTLRIFPLYYAVWILFALLTPVVHIVWHPLNLLWPLYLGNWIPLFQAKLAADPNLDHLTAMLSWKQKPVVFFIGHFWSLCIEEQFYLLWPLIVFKSKDRVALLRLCLLLCVISPLARAGIMHLTAPSFTDDGALGSITFLRFDEFLIGGFAVLMLRGPYADRCRMAAPWLFCGGIASLCGVYIYGRFGLHMETNLLIDRHWASRYGFTLVDLLGLGLVLMCLDRGNPVANLLYRAPMRALGKISYGFYVLHDIPHAAYAALAVRLGLKSQIWLVAIAFLGTVTLSWASYRFLEVPFLRLKAHFEPPEAPRRDQGHSVTS